MSNTYHLNQTHITPVLSAWDDPSWQEIEEFSIAKIYPDEVTHRPDTRGKISYARHGFYGIFRVRDQFVRCQPRQMNDHVSEDSCVSLFLQPFGRQPYFSFEFNAGGVPSAYYIEDPTRIPHGFAKYSRLTVEELQQLRIEHSLPAVTDPEIASPQTWTVGFFLPFSILAKYCGKIEADKLPGTAWHGNFYKCGDQTSHPHWASWNPLIKLNFHRPEDFGNILFN